MKAIPIRRKPSLLAFNFAGERLETLRAFCDSLGVDLLTHTAENDPAAFSLTLGDLLAKKAPADLSGVSDDAKIALEAMVFPEEMFVLADFQNDTLDAFLTGIRERDLWIPLKAVATPTNQGWVPMALRSELMEEHAYMKQMEEENAKKQASDE